MPTRNSETEWKKLHTVIIRMRLQKSTDKDILSFLEARKAEGLSVAGVIKAALREYMKTH